MAVYLLDLTECMAKAGLLLFFCKDNILLKEKYRSVGKILFYLQAVAVSYWLSHSAWVDRRLYGNERGMITNSAHSIVKLAVTVFVCFLAMDLLFEGKRLAKLYLLLVFYAIQEMTRFALYSVWSLSIGGYMEHLTRRVIEESMNVEYFMHLTEVLQFYASVAFFVAHLLPMYLILRWYRKYMTGTVDEISRQGLWFLMLTPTLGMAFGMAWRITFFSRQGTQMEFLYEKHGSMYVVVPLIAILCLACTVFSRKIYSDLVQTEEQKNSLLFYKQQMADMTEHVKEIEQLYDGIRGMRHDINNYVADMEQLLQVSVRNGQIPEQILKEAGGYLHNMQKSASGLTLRFSTGNPVTDVILNRKAQICMQEDIALEGDLLYPEQLAIESFDLGILLNNALDNAIEACRKVPEKQRRVICFRSYCKGRMYFLQVENAYDGRPMQTDRRGLRTTKQENGDKLHGFGMSNMQNCVEKYYGTMQYEAHDGQFALTLMLQG